MKTPLLEIWKLIPEPEYGYSWQYRGRKYEASSIGRIRSSAREECGKKYKAKILVPVPRGKGLFGVRAGYSNPSDIRDLVACAFLGECPFDFYVYQLDHDPANCAIENLVYQHSTTIYWDRHLDMAVCKGLMAKTAKALSCSNLD